jgi:hypothetical protein
VIDRRGGCTPTVVHTPDRTEPVGSNRIEVRGSLSVILLRLAIDDLGEHDRFRDGANVNGRSSRRSR